MASSEPANTQEDIGLRPAVAQLRTILANDTTGQGWDVAWKKNVTPWDRGEMQPSLKAFIESNQVKLPTSGKALVPGCGRGYEAVYLASRLGLETIGMDISQTAIDEAKKNLAMSAIPQDTKITFKRDSFFDYRVDSDDQKFDLCFEHTFFVAIPPDLRKSWGSQMSHLVKKGGYLIALVWPMDGDRPGGPPFSVNVDMYTEALEAGAEAGGWSKLMDEETTVNEERKGKERVVVWKRD